MKTNDIMRQSLGFCTAVATAAVLSFSSAAQAAEIEKKPAWEKSASLGLTLTAGNSDTLLATANLLGTKKWNKNELSLGADAAYGENNSVKNNDYLRGFAQWNRLFNERLFGYLRAEAIHDSIADVDYRITLSPGIGYYFIKQEKIQWSGEFGPGAVLEKQGGVTHEYISLRLSERVNWQINKQARLWHSAEILPQVDHFENFIMNAEIGIETAITEKLSLRTFLQDTYDNEPAPGRKANDVKLVAGVGYKF